jgi:hypothetical protein
MENGLLELQQRLAQAERDGDAVAMAAGYLVLARELEKIGDHRLEAIFFERARENLAAWKIKMPHHVPE